MTVNAGTRTLASYSYGEKNGPLNTLSYGNGHTAEYVYDDIERVTGVRYNDSISNAVSYNNTGHILHITGTGAASYSYDRQGQLTQETRGGATHTYSYDGAGNLLSKTKTDGSGTDTYTYGDSEWKDLLTAYNGSTITYDNGGNPTQWYDGTSFTWVNGRRLASAENSTVTVSYTYDADGLRT